MSRNDSTLTAEVIHSDQLTEQLIPTQLAENIAKPLLFLRQIAVISFSNMLFRVKEVECYFPPKCYARTDLYGKNNDETL